MTGTAAGMHAVVTLPAERTEQDVIEAALERGLLVRGLGHFRLGADCQPPSLVVGYGTPPEHAFSTALGRLCAVLAEAPPG
jgi:GntR family transcriptional regulator/MocR family aminotransferase